MTGESIIKLHLKGDVVVLNAPEDIRQEMLKMGFSTCLDPTRKSENTLVFVTTQEELLLFLDNDLKHIAYDGMLWFLYSKGTPNLKPDINRNILWKLTADYGIRPVVAVSFNERWSALRFRPVEKVISKT